MPASAYSTPVNSQVPHVQARHVRSTRRASYGRCSASPSSREASAPASHPQARIALTRIGLAHSVTTHSGRAQERWCLAGRSVLLQCWHHPLTAPCAVPSLRAIPELILKFESSLGTPPQINSASANTFDWIDEQKTK
jgi:hypothetical protein